MPIRRLALLSLTAMMVVGTARAQVVELSENFTSATAAAGGWTLTSGFWPAQNNSDNPQPYSANGGAWGPGGTLFTSPPGGAYFATDTTATGNANGTVSDWLLTPVITLHNGDTINFSTRTRNPEEGPSSMEVRLSTAGSLTNVGTLPGDVGVFSTLVNTVNASLTPNAYPTSFTTFTFTVSGLTASSTGRIAFHTYYPNGGFAGPNGDTVGLATVTYTTNATTWTWTGATNNNWSNSGNWSPTGVPSSNINNQFTFAATSNPAMNNDIAGVMTLYQMTFNAGSPAYTLAGNGLNFATNGSGVLPQIVVNSTNSITIANAVTLTNNLTVNGTSSLALNGLVSGGGSLTVNGSATVTLGNSSNTYTGGTNITFGTVQVAVDGALGTGNITAAGLGALNYLGSSTTTRSFTLNGGTVSVAAGQTVTLNGSSVSGVNGSLGNGFLDGAGTFATGTNGATFTNMTTTPSVTIASNRPNDKFIGFTNGGFLNVANNVVAGSNVTFNGFTDQGSGTVTLGANSQVNANNFNSFGVLTLTPGTSGGTTMLTNAGSTQLTFSSGSRTFISTVAQASLGNFSAADLELNGQNAVVTGGLLVNNGKVTDSSAAGNATIIADAGALVKGAGIYDNSVVTRNGGKFQAGNSPGVATFGRFVFGPGGVNSYVFAIDNATGQAGPTPNTAGEVSGWGLLKTGQWQRSAGATSGNFAWTADPSNKLTVTLETLINPTISGTDVSGPMANFDPTKAYVWPSLKWVGGYSGPTSAAMLNADTTFDTSEFANPVAGTFGWSLDPAAQTLSLIYTPSAVPEPGTLALTGGAFLVGLRRIRRGRRR